MELRRTPLYDRHQERGADFTDFGGWEMPVSFDSIRVEHQAVRESVGIFDVSHMGEIAVRGPDAKELCQRLTSNDVDALYPGTSQYSTILNEEGVILDDTILYQLDDADYLFIPNAGHDDWMIEHWRTHRDNWDLDAEVKNETERYGMLAVQGPEAIASLEEAGLDEVADIDRNAIVEMTVDGVECLCAGTGYTGEDGVEVLCPWDRTPAVEAALDATPCGLGARDTLRLEMGYVLSGNEFDPETNPRSPLEAGLGFVVDLDAEPRFLGHTALLEEERTGPENSLVGLMMLERGIPRHGYDITDGSGRTIGSVTSGTMSPTLGEPIGLGYVETAFAETGSEVAITVRDAERKARIVTPPFLESR